MKVAGFGFRAAATRASLHDALTHAGGAEGLEAIVTEAAKARSEVFRAFAAELGVPGLGVAASDLEQMLTPTQSQRIIDRFGTGSLCEAAALVMAGPEAALISGRCVSKDGMATAAIAEGTRQ